MNSSDSPLQHLLTEDIVAIQPMDGEVASVFHFHIMTPEESEACNQANPWTFCDGKWGGFGPTSWHRDELHKGFVYEDDHKGGWLRRWNPTLNQWETEFDRASAPPPIPARLAPVVGDFSKFTFPIFDPSLTVKRIQVAAYYCWQRAGCPEGRDQEFWEQGKLEFIEQRAAERACRCVKYTDDAICICTPD